MRDLKDSGFEGSVRSNQRRYGPDHRSRETGSRFALRQDHASDGAEPGQTPTASPHWRPNWGVVYAFGHGYGRTNMAAYRRLHSFSGGGRHRHSMSSYSGDPSGGDWRDLALCEAQHHHQESRGLGADHNLSHAHFRQDRDSDLRPASDDRRVVRTRFYQRPSL